MTPLRALTIALSAVLERTYAAGLAYVPDTSKVGVAYQAAQIAKEALEHLPEGWELHDARRLRRELGELADRAETVAATTRLLLAFRIQQDGHAKTLGDAIDIAEDMERVRALYPELGS